MAGLIAVLIALVVGGKVLSKSRRTEAPPEPAAQIDVPAPAPDLTPSLPVATEQDPAVADTSELKTWGAKQFTFRNRLTGENVPALIVRLPTGSSTQASGYWSFAMIAAYGNCQLDYIDDLQKLKTEYGYQQARHPMVGNPCSRSVYDPLKYAPLPGNVLAGLRPPPAPRDRNQASGKANPRRSHGIASATVRAWRCHRHLFVSRVPVS
jgi:hypothetical protein